MPKLKPADLHHVARLARLRISQADENVRLNEFNQILEFIEKLNELPVEKLKPTFQVQPSDIHSGTPLAEDVPAESLPTEEAIRNAPARQDTFFTVPRMLEDESDREP